MNLPEDQFDLVVVGATPGGIACAIRAAREGLTVLLTHYNDHIGGLWANGLGAVDTQYAGKRVPLYSEWCDRILKYYQDTYGANSQQYRQVITKSHSRYSTKGPSTMEDSVGGSEGPDSLPLKYYGKFNFEPHVAELVFNQMVEADPGITLRKCHIPVEVIKSDRIVEAVVFEPTEGGPKHKVQAKVFADCTYEGDLFALAGVPYAVGRESRQEFGEQHAGRIFTALHFATKEEGGYPRETVEEQLNLEPYEAISQEIFAGSTGEGDHKIQAYTFRLCLSGDPDNRVFPEKPDNYDREIYMRMRNRWSLGSTLPNNKLKWNTSNLPGGNYEYPEADWPKRREILKRHLDHALGFLWFLQNDHEVPEALQKRAKEYGLAKDEFKGNGHVPWEMYVREARRMKGRYIFREQDATLAPGLKRTPIHPDSIAITEWGLDSHSVSMEMVPGSRREGKFLLPELTRPGQVPWRCVLPQELDNLLVPVCLSSTHVGWGTLRLEPTWMHIAESCAIASAMAIREGIAPAQIKVSQLQRTLVESGVMLSFFNDFDMDTEADWVPVIQYLGCKCFFHDYDARPEQTLDEKTATIWAGIVCDILKGDHAHWNTTRWSEIYPSTSDVDDVTPQSFRKIVRESLIKQNLSPDGWDHAWGIGSPDEAPLSRGAACLHVFRFLASNESSSHKTASMQ